MKRFWSLLLALFLTLGVLAGCANARQDAAQPTAKPSVNAAQTNKQTTANATAKASMNTRGNGSKLQISESAAYTDKEHVAAYINEFAKLPHNYITKNEAKKLGWQTKGTLDKVAPGKSIGGDRYGNYEGRLPAKNGRSWWECDIDYVKGSRNAKRLVFSSDGLIYYTGDHYKSFTRLY